MSMIVYWCSGDTDFCGLVVRDLYERKRESVCVLC